MVYLLLAATLLCLAAKSCCAKKTSTYVTDNGQASFFNTFRVFLCVLVGAVTVFVEGAAGSLALDGGMFFICLLSGVANAALLIGFLLAATRISYVTVEVTLTFGSIIPAILCLIFFSESISGTKMIGFALILLATFVLSYGKGKKMGRAGLVGPLFLIMAILGDGLSGFAQQLYKYYYTAEGLYVGEIVYPKSIFHFYTYVFAVAVLVLVYCGFLLARPRGERGAYFKESALAIKKPLPFIVVMSASLFAAMYLQTAITNDFGMPSQILYPVIKGGSLVLVTIMAMMFFGEKPTRRSISGLLLAISGIVVMNVF
ncbi:MAG: hypothetical protein IJC99_01735 [Clostridia bacterium]|nr:hypothetical protein [Clostridia bacterium]